MSGHMRAVVVGASSGIGRCIAVGLGQRGARVALMARRKDRLVDAAAEAGNGSVAIECDVTSASSCQSAVGEAAETLGGVDAVVYTPAIGFPSPLVDTDSATWHRLFDTNVVGAALFTAAVLPHLAESRGTAAYLSSVSASQTAPWPGLGPYLVTKAALDKLVEAWRAEHPGIGFTRVVIGDCAGGEGPGMTEFANQWDWDLAAQFHPIWEKRGLLAGTLVDVADVVSVVDAVVRCGASACVPTVVVAPRPAW